MPTTTTTITGGIDWTTIDDDLAECALAVLNDLGFDEDFQRVKPSNEYNLRFPTALRNNCSDTDFKGVITGVSHMIFEAGFTDGSCQMVDLLYNEAPFNSRAEDLLLDALINCPEVTSNVLGS